MAQSDDISTRYTLARGAKLGKYVVGDVIGRGGLATVYVGFNGADAVALKVMRPATSATIGRIEREAAALGMLKHPSFVRLLDKGQLEDGRFLALEYIAGPRVTDLVKMGGMLPWADAVEMLADACEGFQELHTSELGHGDIKLSNLMVDYGQGPGRLRIIDLDLVRGPEFENDDVVYGSAHTMAPEQVQGGVIAPRTDVYSLGVVLYRLISGQYPVHGANSRATMLAQLTVQPAPIRDIDGAQAIPDELQLLLDSCLAKDPDLRPADAGELGERLRALGIARSDGDVAGWRVGEVPATPVAPKSAGLFGAWVAVASFLVMVACFAVWTFVL